MQNMPKAHIIIQIDLNGLRQEALECLESKIKGLAVEQMVTEEEAPSVDDITTGEMETQEKPELLPISVFEVPYFLEHNEQTESDCEATIRRFMTECEVDAGRLKSVSIVTA